VLPSVMLTGLCMVKHMETIHLCVNLSLLTPFLLFRVENYTSENNELWKKVETLENANR